MDELLNISRKLYFKREGRGIFGRVFLFAPPHARKSFVRNEENKAHSDESKVQGCEYKAKGCENKALVYGRIF
ncbi:MAG: hypothetical protein J5506_05185 [Prevotella sp.]|nr:hypothetical protein [Prevotella sp.]